MIDRAHAIASRPDVIFCSFGDMLRVPGSRGDLLQLKSQGGDVRVVYSPLDAVNLAAANPDRQVVFFAIGFETTAPPNAMAVWLAASARLTNFSVLVSHVLVPPAMTAILESPGNRVQGFLGPGHVCTVMGYDRIRADRRALPRADRRHRLRAARPARRRAAHRAAARSRPGRGREPVRPGRPPRGQSRSRGKLIDDVFEVCDRKWRGVGLIPQERLQAARRSTATTTPSAASRWTTSRRRNRPCASAARSCKGLKKPHECPAFGKDCTPQTPLGATMVSAEGACAAYYAYGRHLETHGQATRPAELRQTRRMTA